MKLKRIEIRLEKPGAGGRLSDGLWDWCHSPQSLMAFAPQ